MSYVPDSFWAKEWQMILARNGRIQKRYDELMHEGKHGHYETMFRVVDEELYRAQLEWQRKLND